VVLGHGARADVEALRGDVADVLSPMGLRLSPAKTPVVHVNDGFRLLGVPRRVAPQARHEQESYVYNFIADRPGGP
jgi:RNA-directed DNA polymerase